MIKILLIAAVMLALLAAVGMAWLPDYTLWGAAILSGWLTYAICIYGWKRWAGKYEDPYRDF